MEAKDYIRIIRRRWLAISICLLIALAGAAAVTFQMTPQYASTARLFVSTPGSDTSQVYQGGLFSQQRVASYADLGSSRRVARMVLQDVATGETPSELAERVTATAIPETVILEITVTDESPRLAQRYAASYAENMRLFITDLESPTDGGPAPIKATIAEEPALADSPVSPQPLRNLGLAAVAGLLAGLAVAVLRERLDTTIKSLGDITSVTEVPVMATIGFDPQADEKPLITDLAGNAPRAEAFKVLRTNIQFVDVDRSRKVFVVTSPVPEEGKTLTAVNLGIALAQSGAKTLLVDADLRRPKAAKRLGLETAVGLTSVLVGQLAVGEALQEHPVSGMDVLASGPVPPNPAELLQSRAMAELLADLRTTYEMVIIDGPPLLPVTDAALLAAHSDGALVVARHGHATRDQLCLAIDRLEAVDARPLGVVLNMMPTRGKASAYGYGYGYGYGPQVT